MLELDADIDEIEKAMSENQIKNTDDLQKSITALNVKIEKRKQKILASNNSEEISIDEPPAKQAKPKSLNKIAFSNEKAMHVFVQNAKKMVKILIFSPYFIIFTMIFF